MASLTQEQVDTLKKKGLTDAKIQALAAQKGFEMPKSSLLGTIGKTLTQSERGFGQSIAGAIGAAVPSLAGGNQVAQANAMSEQVRQNMLNAIKEKRARGEDTARLVNALKTLDSEVNFYDILNTSTGGSLDKSATQVLGEAAGTAVDIASFGTYGAAAKGAKYGGMLGTVPGLVKAAPAAVSGTVGQGIKQGAKFGAKFGALEGAGQAAARAAQEDKSIGQIAGAGVRGGAQGAVLGSVVGGAVGGASSAMQKRGAPEKVLEYVTPTTDELNPKQFQDALSRGLVTPKTTTSPARYILPKPQQEVALKYAKIMEKDPVRTSLNIKQQVGTLDDNVGAFLKQNNGIFSKGELKNHLRSALAEIDDITVDVGRIEKGKTDLIKRFTDSLKKADMENLWLSRKDFDKTIDSAFRGSPSVQKEMKIAFRNAVQEFIADRTPDNVYREYMRDMSNLMRLDENAVAVRATKERGQDAIRLWLKNHPKIAKTLGYGVGIVGVTQVPRLID